MTLTAGTDADPDGRLARIRALGGGDMRLMLCWLDGRCPEYVDAAFERKAAGLTGSSEDVRGSAPAEGT